MRCIVSCTHLSCFLTRNYDVFERLQKLIGEILPWLFDIPRVTIENMSLREYTNGRVIFIIEQLFLFYVP